MLKILVGAVNLFPFRQQLNFSFSLSKWALVTVKGPEALSFLAGQLANDLELLSPEKNILSPFVRITRQANLAFWGLVLNISLEKEFQEFLFFLPPQFSVEAFQKDLELYHVSEEFIWEYPKNLGIPTVTASPQKIKANFFQEEWFLKFEKEKKEDLSLREKNSYFLALGLPPEEVSSCCWAGLPIFHTPFLPFISLSKGCFLGQATLNKVLSHRGPSLFPKVFFSPGYEGKKLLETAEGGFFLQKRDLLYTPSSSLVVGVDPASLESPGPSLKEKALFYLDQGFSHFKQGEEEKSCLCFEQAVQYEPTLEEAYEAMGVVLGRLGHFEKAIEWMDKLLAVNSLSPMAHTNKSVYFMKLGHIQKAEEEKSLATVKEFQRLGKIHQTKKQEQEQQALEEKKQQDRFKLFQEVLAIDENDEMALYGVAEIFFQQNKKKESRLFLERLLEANPEYSQTYYLLTKLTLEENKLSEANEWKEKGMAIALKKGEMAIANRLRELKVIY